MYVVAADGAAVLRRGGPRQGQRAGACARCPTDSPVVTAGTPTVTVTLTSLLNRKWLDEVPSEPGCWVNAIIPQISVEPLEA